jgi:hypothetical protein
MELLEDHPTEERGDDSDQSAAGGDGTDLGALGGDDTRDDGDDQAAPDGGDDDLEDPPE